jgi:hypothetical protein
MIYTPNIYTETNTENKEEPLTNEHQIMANKLIANVKADRKARKREIKDLTNDFVFDIFSTLDYLPDVNLSNEQYVFLSKAIKRSLKSYRKALQVL